MTEQIQRVETEMVVRYAETDQMGNAHHSNYPVWFEIGRTDFFKKIGFPYSQIKSMGIFIAAERYEVGIFQASQI